MKAAKDYNRALVEAGSNDWKAVILAHDMREMFPKKGRHGGEGGWQAFCKEILCRTPATIAERIRAARYMDETNAGWEKDGFLSLPPWYLVAELAAREPGTARTALHETLFSGQYASPQDFRRMLANLRQIEQRFNPLNDPVPKNRGKSGKKRKGGRGQSGQFLPIQEATTLLTGLFKERVRTIPAKDEWMTVEELGLDLGEKLKSNAATIMQHGGMVIIKPAGGASHE